MYLIINTAKQNEIFTAVFAGQKIFSEKLKVEFHESEKLLPLINHLFKENNFKLKDLRAIFVVSGPGLFTSLRIAISSANALAYALGIPVVGIKTNEFKNIKDLIKKGEAKLKKTKTTKIALPFYGQSPNITKPKKKWLK